MSEYDPKTGKLRPTWLVRFTPWQAMLGSLVAGAVCGIVLVITFVTGPDFGELAGPASVAQGSAIVVGASVAVFALLGPTLAWGLGFSLRNVQNQYLHVLAFAALGAFVGFSLGNAASVWLGFGGLGSVLAPAAGIGAAVGRWVLSPYSRV